MHRHSQEEEEAEQEAEEEVSMLMVCAPPAQATMHNSMQKLKKK